MVTVLTFLAVFFTLLAIRESLYASRRQVEERLQQITVQPGKTEVAGAVKKRRSFVWLREIITGFKPARGFVERLEDRLCQADILLKAEEFLILTAGATVLTGLIGYATTHKVAGGLIGLFFGLALPNLALRMAQNRRLKAFDAQVADCIVIMANTLRAGFGFMQAMEVVRREMGPPISKEFGRALTEINLGISTEEALNNLVKRVKSEDMDLVVTAMIIQRSVGGNLAGILDTIAETIRERVRLKGEIKALTAQGRISGMVIGFMPFALALMLYFVNPEYILMLFQNKLGMVMLTVAGAGELIGLFLIKKIVDIKV
ncbi:MAG: type II secretion system F family protein [Firmicutes bacterium]|nr:type II secretion system F family protein [Bacillota bacterium]